MKRCKIRLLHKYQCDSLYYFKKALPMGVKMIALNIKDNLFRFKASPRVFSPRYVDKGTLFMLSLADFNKTDKILDLGCGYGVVGITAAKFADPRNVYMTDSDDEALRLARENASLNGVEGVHILKSDAYESLDETGFDLILSNPPYHTDFSLAKRFIEKGFNRLKIGGRFFMVTKREEWYKRKFISIFGGVKIFRGDGYTVFVAERRTAGYNS